MIINGCVIGLIYTFNEIPTPYGLFNAKIWYKWFAHIYMILNKKHQSYKSEWWRSLDPSLVTSVMVNNRVWNVEKNLKKEKKKEKSFFHCECCVSYSTPVPLPKQTTKHDKQSILLTSKICLQFVFWIFLHCLISRCTVYSYPHLMSRYVLADFLLHL